MGRLVVVTQGLTGLTGLTHELNGAWTTIGRADANAFKLNDSSVSSQHCEVRLRGDELEVRDLCSTNGTFVKGGKINEAMLKAGQVLRVGEVELRFEATVVGLSPATPYVNTMLVRPATKAIPTCAAPDAVQVNPPKAGDGSARNYQVLFVDDSLAFIETFGELCCVLSNRSWEIHAAASADQALAVMQQHAIDLTVLDIGIPMVDGIQLLGIIKRRNPGVRIAILTGKSTESNRSMCLIGGADLFIEKPLSTDGFKIIFNMLNDLVSWPQRDGFSGTLHQVGLPEVIQMECIGRRRLILEVRNHEVLGEIYIETGAITHAKVGDLAGAKALNRLLSLTGGEFRLKAFTPPAQRTVDQPWEYLLMEAARCRDEETDFLQRNPTETEITKKAVEPEPDPVEPETVPVADNHAGPNDDFVVVATYDGKWSATDVPNN
jgi:CheY-like chemotaxis protein